MDSTAINYNPNANYDDGLCLYAGCTNPEAENYDPNASINDGSCVIIGCTLDAWFVCNYNPEATQNDWSICEFDFSGGCAQAMYINGPDTYPMMELSDLTDDVIDAYYYLGPDRIGCMDKSALNYLKTAVLDDESCISSIIEISNILENHHLMIYPQPATSNVTIDIFGYDILDHKELVIYNILGEQIYIAETLKNKSININVDNWKPGVYSVVLKMENNNLRYRFIVE